MALQNNLTDIAIILCLATILQWVPCCIWHTLVPWFLVLCFHPIVLWLLLQRKESAADSTATAAAPKKIKLSVKLSAPKADTAATADQTPNQPPAEKSRAAADRPRVLGPSEPEHILAPPSRAAASRPEGSEKPLKVAASRARLSEPSRAAPNRPGHHRLSKVGCLSAPFLPKCLLFGCLLFVIVLELQWQELKRPHIMLHVVSR